MALPFLSPQSIAAWCIVPYDSQQRDPQARAQMLTRLGIGRIVWDWRDEHLPHYEAELDALEDAGIELSGLWCPVPPATELADLPADVVGLVTRAAERGHRPQLWACTEFGSPWEGPALDEEETAALVADTTRRLAPLASLGDEFGFELGLYNHMGWFGEPDHQVLVADALLAQGYSHVGLVYQQHHAHTQMSRFADLWPRIAPRVIAFGLNGMVPGAAAGGRKIHPYGHGPHDVELAQVVAESGWTGLTTILGHTMDDVELRLADNLDGLQWVREQLAAGTGAGASASASMPPVARIPEPIWPH